MFVSKYAIKCANNGVEAVEKVKKALDEHAHEYDKIDIVLIDYYMPGMDGPDAIKAMREMGYGGLIFALTASAAEVDRDKLLQAGADNILLKPFNMKQFKKCLFGK